MAETVSKRTKIASPREREELDRPAAARKGPSLTVRYWKKMRPNKVYPIVVSSKGRADIAPLTLRLIMAGAQVVPAEQQLDPSNPGEKVTFYVTPLAKGYLRAERLEVLQDGVKIQELRMPSRVVTQKATLVWLFLSLFIPWLILHFFYYAPIGYQPTLEDSGIQRYVRKPWQNYAVGPNEPRASRITDFMTDNTPNLDALIGDNKDLQETYTDVREFPEKIYIHLFRLHRDMRQPIAFYVFLFLLLITFISFVLKQEGRKTATGKPLMVETAPD